MLYLFMLLFVLVIVAADQLTKLWVVNHIGSSLCADAAACAQHIEELKAVYHVSEEKLAELPRYVEGIPGIFRFAHVHNTGAAFSSFQGAQWLFALVFVVFTVAVVYEAITRKMGFSTFERWCIAAMYGGALGNMIDRVRMGFVVDMLQVEFMNFPVFNVADCFICCGAIALIISLIFDKDFWKKELK